MSRHSFSNSLSWRIIGIVSAIFFVVMVVIAIVSHQIIADEATRSTQHILHGTISELEKPLNRVEVSTHAVAAYISTLKTQPQVLQAIAERTVEVSDLINGFAIIFVLPDGSIDTLRPAIFSYSDKDGIHDFRPDCQQITQLCTLWNLQQLQETKMASWTAPYIPFDTRASRVVSYCYPLVDSMLNIYAIVISDMVIDQIESTVEGIRPYDNSIAALIFNKDNIIGVKSSDSDLINRFKRSFSGNSSYEEMVEDIRSNKDSIRRRVGKGRDLAFVVYGPLHNGWKLSITCPYREVLRRSSQMHIALLIIGLIGLIIIFFVCRRVIRRMTRPITELSVSALNMAKGNFKAELPEITTQDEMLRLHDSFIYMQNSIADYIEQLKTTTNANERMESELNVARNIQMGMLRTDFPPQLYALLNPAKEVGGDLYDFTLKGDQLYFAIGDVSGKGVPAALMMAITRATIRFVASLGLPLNETLSRVNNSFIDTNSTNMFVTLFVGRINLKTLHMDFCNAGHNPLVILPPDGDPYFLKAKANLAIGLIENFAYEAESLDLKPGTRIIAYTDGVNEAENASEEFYGNDRLLETIRQMNRDMTSETAVNLLIDSVKTFAYGNPQNDDVTLMSIQL
ncbi:MAG: SpoIIE family protein phosphatase [Bacteroidales bacterium]|nr:SpoIIE family protein phosphatase [Bacteroidales bacterium]